MLNELVELDFQVEKLIQGRFQSNQLVDDCLITVKIGQISAGRSRSSDWIDLGWIALIIELDLKLVFFSPSLWIYSLVNNSKVRLANDKLTKMHNVYCEANICINVLNYI